jgi:uridine kinase
MMGDPTYVIAIVGGSGSGKTTLAKKILSLLGERDGVILGQDSYYIDQSARFDRDGGAVNFDHPDSLEFSLLGSHLKELKNGQNIEVPVYDFASHKRLVKTETLQHRPVILVDGTLILSQSPLLPLFDESIFLEVDEDTRFQRRLRRDVQERGRKPEGVREQFFKQVKVMHDEFVEPSKVESSILIRDGRFVVQKESGCGFRARLLELLRTIES